MVVRSQEDRFARAKLLMDDVHRQDPRPAAGANSPSTESLLYARRMLETLGWHEPEASIALRLAAYAQHIGRWQIARESYPEGRSGYLRWRIRLGQLHAEIAISCLAEAGYDDGTQEKVARLLRKKGLGHDPMMQTLEDVICLVFLQHYLDDFAAKHLEDKMINILRKTWRKMTEQGHQAALKLPLSQQAQVLVEKALESAQ